MNYTATSVKGSFVPKADHFGTNKKNFTKLEVYVANGERANRIQNFN